ncbi:MAG: hypothetical protein KME29_30865 [Calothrix sp. FI2-JRJ7]|jgi:hypothetical protein|nr:hypothetical protein [Calothrix sp. FI2-JRJ7]
MLKKLLSPCSGAHTWHLLNLTLGIGATLAIASPSFAQSTIIYQRTNTYDNYTYPHVTQYIYGSPIPTPYPVNPIGGQSLFPPKTNLFEQNPTNSLFPNNPSNNILFPEVRVYRRPHVRQYVNESTLVNPVLVNPNIRNSTIINPTIINNPYYRRQPRRFMYKY